MQSADLPTIVRVPSKEYHHIARAAGHGRRGHHAADGRLARRSPRDPRLHEVPPARAARRRARGGARPLHARADARQARGGEPVDHPVHPDRDPRRRRQRRRDRRARWRRLPVGRALRSQRLARHSGPVPAQGLHRRDQDGDQGLPQARQERGPARADRGRRRGLPPDGLRLHLLLGRRLGAARRGAAGGQRDPRACGAGARPPADVRKGQGKSKTRGKLKDKPRSKAKKGQK